MLVTRVGLSRLRTTKTLEGLLGGSARIGITPSETRHLGVASTAREDSHRTILDQDSWDLTRFIECGGPLLLDHGWDWDVGYEPIGRFLTEGETAIRVEGTGKDARLLGEFFFDEPPEDTIDPVELTTRRIERKVRAGFITGLSVGFRYRTIRALHELPEDHWAYDADKDRGASFLSGLILHEITVTAFPSNLDGSITPERAVHLPDSSSPPTLLWG